MARKTVFVMGADPFNLAMLKRLNGAEQLEFRSLLDKERLVDTMDFDIDALLRQIREQLEAEDVRPDAIVGYWDFPTSTLLPIVRREQGLPGPSLEAVLRCEHKYWSRVEQDRVAPEDTPRFAAFNPFDEDIVNRPVMPYPFWVKPIRSHSSMLGFRINNQADWQQAVLALRDEIPKLARPFNQLMDRAEVPAEIRAIDGYHALAEEIISAGRQCTVEGYVLDGEIRFHGVIDSMREGVHHSSFSRYQYPSSLPEEAKARMYADCARFLKRVAFDNSPFNVEFFYDEEAEQVRLLEVNTRISKSHAPLFEMVEGSANFQIMVDVALGRRPAFPLTGGAWPCAAKFMLREETDARVLRVPTQEELQAIEEEIPGCRIQVDAREGARLSDMLHQDSYSFEIATVFLGGQNQQDLEEKLERVKERLDFDFD